MRALAFDMSVVAYRRTDTPSPLPEVAIVPEAHGPPVGLGSSGRRRAGYRGHPAPPRRSRFESIKPGVHLVNISRGALVDQDALLDALDDGRVAMATLDVTDPEPLTEDHRLYAHPRVRISPHVSWSAPKTPRRTMELFEENFR